MDYIFIVSVLDQFLINFSFTKNCAYGFENLMIFTQC
jgi:hypothetical protein